MTQNVFKADVTGVSIFNSKSKSQMWSLGLHSGRVRTANAYNVDTGPTYLFDLSTIQQLAFFYHTRNDKW